jgi:hypothetical protein
VSQDEYYFKTTNVLSVIAPMVFKKILTPGCTVMMGGYVINLQNIRTKKTVR